MNGPAETASTAEGVSNEGSRSEVADLFEFAADLENQVFSMMNLLEQVQETFFQLTELCSESLSYASFDDTA